MNIKLGIAAVLVIFGCYSCKKSNTATPTVATIGSAANIDSIAGYYVGTTSGDSIYTYTDGTGAVKQWIQSFSWPDTIQLSSADSISITAASKYYNITYGYGDSLTFEFVSYLQNQTLGQNGYSAYNTTLVDSANSVNHVIIDVWYSYNKHYQSNVTLLRR